MPDLTKMTIEELLKMYAAPDFDTEEDPLNIVVGSAALAAKGVERE